MAEQYNYDEKRKNLAAFFLLAEAELTGIESDAPTFMKQHAGNLITLVSEGLEIIRQMFPDTDEDEFREIAEGQIEAKGWA